MAPKPSASASVLLAINVWSSVGVPAILTTPVGASFKFAIGPTPALETDSFVPFKSM